MSSVARIAALALAGALAAPALRAADFTVDDPADLVDATPGDGACMTAGGTCTLRAAIQEANALAGADRVVLPAGTFTLAIDGQNEDLAATGDLDIADALVVEGAGPGATVVDGAGLDRVFDIGAESTLRGLTVTGGDAGGLNGGGIFSAPFGPDFTLTIERVHFADNTAQHGGAIHNETGSTLVVRQASFTGNAAPFGAAIENQDLAALENVTVSGNTQTSGGGLRNDGTLALAHVTVVDEMISSSGALSVGASVLDAGAGGTVCTAMTAATSTGDNVEHGTSCSLAGAGDQSGVDPLLAPLEDAGDGTWSHALLAGSPAIDRVAACPPPAVDQRDAPRPVDGDAVAGALCDAGAVEAPVPGATTTSTSIPGTTTTTTIGGTTTTTTLPDPIRLPGRKLLLGDSATRPAKRKLVLLAKDPAITLGDGNGSADDPVQTQGSSLRVTASGGDGFDATYALPASGWIYLKGEGKGRGYKFRKGTPVRKVIVKPGKVLKVIAKGEALTHTLATQPDAVRVELRLGARRYCFEFGGTPAFKPGKRYRATGAPAPAACLSELP